MFIVINQVSVVIFSNPVLNVFFKGLHRPINLPYHQEMNLADMNRSGASRFNYIRQTVPDEDNVPPAYDSLFAVQKL
jgi:hypothetical protein